ncbi:MAG: hypothetical protein JF588_15315 [Caulobacterales bacterium]|nr:hypothetical protein [Caulobacterales bacterium]
MATSIVVARTRLDGLEYLADDAKVVWTNASQSAARFETLRDATRAAMRLPSNMRAFALPLSA